MATYIELRQQIEELQKEADALKTKERQGVIDRMKEAIAVYDITAQELGLGMRDSSIRGRASVKKSGPKPKASRKSGELRPAYGDGAGNTWGGRGPRPKWLKNALAGGANLEQFAQK